MDHHREGTTSVTLPSFPVDPVTLDLVWDALHPTPDTPHTTLGHTLEVLSMLGGSDPTAVVDVDGPVRHLRDAQYAPADVIRALITEIRHHRHIAWVNGTQGDHP